MKLFLLTIALSLTCIAAGAQTPIPANAPPVYHEKYRPQLHFSPKAHWMNDPNGMVFYKGTYHLFFQYYPDSSVWGPMHWGHATSTDLVHWRQEPIALYPDSLGYIFSGSAVVDKNNTSGFGKKGQPPLVAIFTQHDPIGAKRNRNDYQTQSIAYSLDNGRTWTKYAQNPVIKNPGITDFRDPKVSWYEPAKTWIMTLAVKDKVFFYSSPDLKSWRLNSEFGHEAGAHGGVWECPDLFAIDYQGRAVWVLIVNINPGGPNGGSATQYFLGDFDGKKFTPSTAGTRWLDYGPDEYAGVTWSNTGTRRIFLGWMSNWLYGQAVPTSPWRSATTLPRQLGLQRVKDSLYLTEQPVKELAGQVSAVKPAAAFTKITTPLKLNLSTGSGNSFAITFSNDAGENTTLGYDKAANQYYIDRNHSGRIDFSKDFAGRYTAPRIADSGKITLTIYADASSFELFADGGLTTMTALVFPSRPYTKMEISSADGSRPESLKLSNLKSIWK
jgi:fructan beta-fructosidase